MIGRTVLIGAMALLVGCRQAGHASPPDQEGVASSRLRENESEAKETVERLEREWSDAYARKDLTWYDRHVAAGYRTILSDGRTLTRDQVINFVRSSPAPQSITTDEVDVRLYGNFAIALVTQSFVGADGERGRLKMTDLWVRPADGRWQVVHSHEASLRP